MDERKLRPKEKQNPKTRKRESGERDGGEGPRKEKIFRVNGAVMCVCVVWCGTESIRGREGETLFVINLLEPNEPGA